MSIDKLIGREITARNGAVGTITECGFTCGRFTVKWGDRIDTAWRNGDRGAHIDPADTRVGTVARKRDADMIGIITARDGASYSVAWSDGT